MLAEHQNAVTDALPRELTGKAYRALWWLAARHQNRPRVVRVTAGWIADRTGSHRNTIGQGIAELRERGVIRVKRTGGASLIEFTALVPIEASRCTDRRASDACETVHPMPEDAGIDEGAMQADRASDATGRGHPMPASAGTFLPSPSTNTSTNAGGDELDQLRTAARSRAVAACWRRRELPVPERAALLALEHERIDELSADELRAYEPPTREEPDPCTTTEPIPSDCPSTCAPAGTASA